MKRFIVLSCDNDSPYVHVLDVEQTFNGVTGNVEYVRPPARPAIFLERIGPRLYGKLQAILFSSETIVNAGPIEAEVQPEDAELDRMLKEAFAASPETGGANAHS